MNIGQIIHRKKGGPVTILEVGNFLLKVEDETGKQFSVKRTDLESGPSLDAVNLATGLVAYVTKLRIVYPAHAQVYLDKQASIHGVVLDPRTRPTEAGKRGGVTLQHTAAAEIEFSPETPSNLLPEGLEPSPSGVYKLNSLAVAFALLKSGASQTAFV